MKLTCPACGSVASLDVLIGHEGARDAVMAALAIPANIGKPLVMYLALFRPPKRALSFERVAALLRELQPMIEDAKIMRDGRIWSAPQEYWHMALSEMIAKRDTLTLPLKSHGYLLTIIAGYSSKAEAKQEAATEARKAGHTPVGAVSPSPIGGGVGVGEKPRTQMPKSVKAALKKGDTDDHL